MGLDIKVMGKVFGFRAGSYSGYNAWRRQLCLTAIGVSPEEVWREREKDKSAFADKPFIELIDFTDCDGTLDQSECIRLHEDFEDHADRILSAHAKDGDFCELYKRFRSAFSIAVSEGGTVVFA